MPITAAIVIGIIAAVVCTILSVIMITPAKKRNALSPFFKFLHDLFNFKTLFIEKILKFIYILLTLGCVFIGFLMLFSGTYYTDYWTDTTHFQSTFGQGLLILILGPVAIRITYESLMMFILLVQNVIELNRKTPDNNKAEEKVEEIVEEKVEAPVAKVFCTKCGTQYEVGSSCPNCNE